MLGRGGTDVERCQQARPSIDGGHDRVDQLSRELLRQRLDYRCSLSRSRLSQIFHNRLHCREADPGEVCRLQEVSRHDFMNTVMTVLAHRHGELELLSGDLSDIQARLRG